jgi:xanthosine utilization system XapX-like protein
MTDTQIFQVLGILYLAIGLGTLINHDFYKKLLTVFSENPPAIYLSGLVALVIGYLLVTFHNIWPSDWPVIITIFGWLALIKGLVLLLLPRVSIKICKIFESQMTTFLPVWALVMAVAGIILAWLGFRTL